MTVPVDGARPRVGGLLSGNPRTLGLTPFVGPIRSAGTIRYGQRYGLTMRKARIEESVCVIDYRWPMGAGGTSSPNAADNCAA